MEPPHSLDQSLRFLTFTPDRPNDDESRRIVRSHAIRDAIRKRQLETTPGQKKPSPKLPLIPRSQAEHTGRFRLGKPKTKPRAKAQAASRRKEPNSRTADSEDHEDHEGCSGECLQGLERHRHSLVPGPGDGRLDPFDTLPIKIGSRQKLLIQYQDAAFKQNNFVYNPCETISYAAADPAWLNATLSLVSLHFDLSTGRKVSQESLFHRGEALRIVNERLRTSFEVFSDGTIGAVASLANFDTMNGSFTGATTHHKGLMQMVSKRGGLLGLDEKSILQKNVGWTDLCYSLSWDRIPQLPVIQTLDCNGTIDQYLDHFGALYSTDLSSSADLFGEISLVLQSMRVLSIIMAKEDISNMDRAIFTRGVYIAEYSLLTILDEVNYSKDAPTLCSTHRNSHVYGSCRLAAYLYLYLALRELPKSAKIVQTLVKRLESTLGTVTGDLLLVWKDDLYLLLWILSMGGTAASGPTERQYFVKLLARVVRVMNLESLQMFKDALRVVLWLEDFCAPQSARLWEEMGLASVPPL